MPPSSTPQTHTHTPRHTFVVGVGTVVAFAVVAAVAVVGAAVTAAVVVVVAAAAAVVVVVVVVAVVLFLQWLRVLVPWFSLLLCGVFLRFADLIHVLLLSLLLRFTAH
jgi:hypothetical protein